MPFTSLSHRFHCVHSLFPSVKPLSNLFPFLSEWTSRLGGPAEALHALQISVSSCSLCVAMSGSCRGDGETRREHFSLEELITKAHNSRRVEDESKMSHNQNSLEFI